MAANVNNYIAAGKSADRESVKIRTALAQGKPRVDKIAKAQITANAREKGQAFANNRAVAKAGLTEIASLTNVDRKIKAESDIRDSRKGAKMTGVLAGGIAAVGAGAVMMNQKEEANPMLDMYKEYSDKYSDTSGIDGKISAARSELERLKGLTGSNNSSNTGLDTGDSSSATGGTKALGGSKTGIRLAKDLIAKGYSKSSAAAVAGNAQHESMGFTAHEELADNSYGTRGAGYLQWTNTNSPRRDEFESYAKNNGFDPTSYEASAGYISKEMEGGAHWTGDTNTDSFKGMTDVSSATRTYMKNYLRPNEDHEHFDRRLTAAQSIYSAL
jgi:hypothetical protein